MIEFSGLQTEGEAVDASLQVHEAVLRAATELLSRDKILDRIYRINRIDRIGIACVPGFERA